MKIIFIYPNLTGQEVISIGIADLSAYIKIKGHQTSLIDFTWGTTTTQAIKKIKQTNPDLIAFSLRSGEYKFCLNLAKKIKQNFKTIPIIFGGIHPTVNPEHVIKQNCVDMICIGEGEQALTELLDCLEKRKDYSQIQNLWVKKEGQIIKNPSRPLLQTLNDLPFSDRELFNYQHYINSVNGRIYIMVGRGCPFSCSYCINAFNKKNFQGRYVRLRSPEKVIEEIKEIQKNYQGIKNIFFYDDVFAYDKNWLKNFCQFYTEKVGLPFTCNTRPECLDEEVCSWLKKAGCEGVMMGVESGSEKIRKLLKRYTTNKKIIEAFNLAKKWGFKTFSFNMVGLPFETLEDYWDTIRLNQVIKPTYLQVSLFQPYPGTELYDLCVKEKFFEKDSFLPEGHSYFCVLNFPEISKWRLEWRRKLFRFRVLRAYAWKKALFVLFFDSFFIFYWKLRSKLPIGMKRVIQKIKVKLR